MFIAMNRFKITAGREADFEETWRRRESYLAGVPGFLAISLLRSATSADGTTEFISHSTWRSREDFDAWRASEEFRRGHAPGSGEGVRAPSRKICLAAMIFISAGASRSEKESQVAGDK